MTASTALVLFAAAVLVGLGGLAMPLVVTAGTTSSFAIGSGNLDDWFCEPDEEACDLGGKDFWVREDDGDTTYVYSGSNEEAQTFRFADAGVPLLSVVNSVTLDVVAKRVGGGNGRFALMAEQGTGVGEQHQGPNISPSTSYATYSFSLPTNPFTGSAWTVNEVNRWETTGTNFGFTRTNSSGTVRVTKARLIVDYGPSSKPMPNSVTIVKIARTQDGTDFEFTDFNGASFFLDDANPDDKDLVTDRVTYTELSPGTYTFTEIMPEGWFVENIFCEGDTDGGTVNGGIQGFVHVDLDEGEEIACAFVNSTDAPA
jgi:hypothetical protein